jgi:hypothetical protein
MRYFLIILTLFLFTYNSTQAQNITSQDTVDACITDFTKINDFSARRATVFGLYIGISIKEARAAIDSFKTYKLKLEQDRYNNNRMYLYEILGNDSIKKPIGLCKWQSATSGLNELILYEEASECLPGDIYTLFSGKAIDSVANPVKDFLGNPTKVVVDMDVPSLGLKSTRYYFAKRALIVIENRKPEETTYHLAFYKSLL